LGSFAGTKQSLLGTPAVDLHNHPAQFLRFQFQDERSTRGGKFIQGWSRRLITCNRGARSRRDRLSRSGRSRRSRHGREGKRLTSALGRESRGLHLGGGRLRYRTTDHNGGLLSVQEQHQPEQSHAHRRYHHLAVGLLPPLILSLLQPQALALILLVIESPCRL